MYGQSERKIDLLVIAIGWLKERPQRRFISSYELKHLFEHETGDYLINGMFILAALLAGLRIKRVKDSPNPLLKSGLTIGNDLWEGLGA
jgi:hypothetical protein